VKPCSLAELYRRSDPGDVGFTPFSNVIQLRAS
jgi:hypothetical protein